MIVKTDDGKALEHLISVHMGQMFHFIDYYNGMEKWTSEERQEKYEFWHNSLKKTIKIEMQTAFDEGRKFQSNNPDLEIHT